MSSLLNDRMRAKIKVLPAAAPLSELAPLLEPRALVSWAKLLEPRPVDWTADVPIIHGACEFTARWLEPHEAVTWCVSLVSGSSVQLTVSSVTGGRGSEIKVEQLHSAVLTQTATGKYVAGAEGGALWLVADNTESWMYDMAIRLSLVSEPAAQAAVSAAEPVAAAAAQLAAVELD